MSVIESIGHLMLTIRLADILEAGFGSMKKNVSGENLHQNTIVLQSVVEELFSLKVPLH